jgi:wyosine [tRNA(Phe)-imidazoG37] synthetase (radical SAM superfamily)
VSNPDFHIVDDPEAYLYEPAGIHIHKHVLFSMLGQGRHDVMEREVSRYDIEFIARAFADDPWKRNLMTSYWEFARGETVLRSYPWDVCIPIADTCNARCTFCTSWLEGTQVLDLADLDRFEEVLRHAYNIGLAGHGEPLAHPRIADILARLQDWIHPLAGCYVITNGVHLADHLDELIKARVKSYAISLNAASEAVHREVMGLRDGDFPRILESIRALVDRRNDKQVGWISISLVVTRQNIHEVPRFIELGNELGVNNIQLKTLAGAGGSIPGLNYHLLPAYEHPEYAQLKQTAKDAITASTVPCQVDLGSWDTPVFPAAVRQGFTENPPRGYSRREAQTSNEVRDYWRAQQKYAAPARGLYKNFENDFDGNNPYGRQARYGCRAPYYFLYINDFSYSAVPCCYMNRVPGHEHVTFDGTTGFFEAWNSPAMVELRRRLRDGPLFNMCTKCPATY